MGLDLGGVVGNLTGGLIGTSDAERAAVEAKGLSAQARKDILAELETSWGDVKGFLDPWLQEGKRGLNMYKQAIGASPEAPVFEGFSFDPSKIEENPAYQFVRDQGMQAVERNMAKNRGLTSGNMQTAIADYMGGLASQEYQNEFGRQLQTYGTRETAKSRNFDARNLLNRQRVGDTSHLMSFGPTFANNLATMRDRLSGSRAGAHSNYAAEQTAANLIPAQEKMSFMQGLMGMGGAIAGSRSGGK